MNFTLMSFAEVAERSGLNPNGGARTVRKWVSGGALPVITLPSGAKRIDSRDFEKFIESRKTPAIATPEPKSLLASLGLPKRSRTPRPTTSRSTEPTPPPCGLGSKRRGAG